MRVRWLRRGWSGTRIIGRASICSLACTWLGVSSLCRHRSLPRLDIAKASTAAEAAFLRSLAGGDFRVEALTTADYARMAEQCADLPLGTTDVAVITVAERLNAQEVATLDHRHFAVVAEPKRALSLSAVLCGGSAGPCCQRRAGVRLLIFC